MERIFLVVSQMHYPSAIVSVRSKQDQLRGVLERTRSDIALAVASHRTAERIETASRR